MSIVGIRFVGSLFCTLFSVVFPVCAPEWRGNMTKKSDNTTIGGRIRNCRLKAEMTQEELAVRLCTTKPLISQYENNKVDIKGSIILELAEILDTTAGYLLNEEFSGDIMDEIEKEMIGIFKMLENDKTRQVALEQLKSLSKL